VVHLKRAIVELAKEYQEKGVSFIAVSSNSVKSHPEDGPDMMASDAKRYGYTFPYLYDESQDVARAYNTACTPEFLVFDKDLKLTYHGRFDDSSPGRGTAITGKDIRTALNATLAGQAVAQPWRPSIGCSIKWESGGGRW
jgi:thiol-disulfide isomerase/thioredoxin